MRAATYAAFRARLLDPILTTGDVGRLLGVTQETVRKYIADGDLCGFKLPGGQYRVNLSDLMEFAATETEAA